MIGVTASRSRPATAATKAALRRRVRAGRRDRLTLRDAEAEAQGLADAVIALVATHSGGSVCVVAAYEARPTEPATHRLVERLTAAGHRVIVPVTLPDLDLDWRDAGTGEETGPGAYRGKDAIAEADVIVVPALAVDRDGNRLGQGGGSYDRALARCRDDALIVALVHDGELLDAGEVAVDDHDLGVHVAVTPSAGAVSLTRPG
jgi:5-formyltetrahydrofolate cyclo-ligase